MQGFPYELRLRLSDEVESDGQTVVMHRIPVFDTAETVNRGADAPQGKETVKVTVLNMEHGCRNKEIFSFLTSCSELKDTDILLASELDDGTYRSGNFDSTDAIAEALGFNSAYGLEFIELVDKRDQKGYEGNAIFSRYPIVRADVLHLTEEYNWYFDTQKRIGERVAVFAEMDVHGNHVGAVSIHLENRTTPEGRARQIKGILEKADDWFGNIPVVIGGDFNFYTFYGPDKEQGQVFLDEQMNGQVRDVDRYEPSFALFEKYGYEYKSFNGRYLPTCRDRINGCPVWLHLDWIFAKGMTCIGKGMVSTLTEDCIKWVPGDSPILEYKGTELSDHNAVWAECKLEIK